jgi:regulatory protein
MVIPACGSVSKLDPSSEDESSRLREVAEDRARALGSLSPEVAKRRLVAYLQRRGYSGNEIFSVVDEVLR